MKTGWILAALLITCAPALTSAQDSEELRLTTISKQLDGEGKANTHVESLAKEYNVSEKTVSDLRNKYGWGGANISLAMAQRLYATDPRTYPTMEQALQKIGGLHAEKMGWGKMAHQLGFQLGPVVSAAERQLPAQDVHLTHSQNVGRAAKIERPERVDRPDRSDKPPHPRQ